MLPCIFEIAAGLHDEGQAIRFVAFYKDHHAVGNQTSNGSNPTSTANSGKMWSGTIQLELGYYNITVEYHNGNSGGTLILWSGYDAINQQVSLCLYVLQVLQTFGQLCAVSHQVFLQDC